MQRGAAGPTRDIQKTARRSETEPTGEPLELVNCQPAVLADVLAERGTSNLRMHVSGKLPVLRAVVIGDIRLLRHPTSL